MKKLIVLVLMVAIAGISCKSPSGPDIPPQPPFEEKRYTIKVEYIRHDVMRPDLMWKVVSVTITDRNSQRSVASEQMEKKDDYHYEKQFAGILETESYGNLYYIYGVDRARGDGKKDDYGKYINDDKAVVGDRFILTVVETGFSLELTNIVQNNLDENPSKGLNAKMAIFCLKRDGTLTNGN